MGKRSKKESFYIKGICVKCHINKQTSRGINKKNGKKIYRQLCSGCFRDSKGLVRGNIKKTDFYKKLICENCGFIPLHKCQLDVDHIDGNHENNNPDNFQTLCANCHRLKTFINKDWKLNSNA